MTEQPVRPRYGKWFTGNGGEILLVFHPDQADPTTFVGVRADTGGPIAFVPGDQVEVDVLGPGQSVRIRTILATG